MTEGPVIRRTPTARLELDVASDGIHFGRIALANSTNRQGWGELHIPIVSVRNGDGPAHLVIGGTHGDEYESQVCLLQLVEELDATDVHGQLIIIPTISGAASAAGTRLWPDGTNLNRAFPGAETGSAATRLADFVTRVLFPMVDTVVDIHSGGRSMVFTPMATVHLPPDPRQRSEMLAAATAWGTDLCLVSLFSADGGGLLNEEAVQLGITVATAELGGGATLTAASVAAAHRSILNLLHHLGALVGERPTRQDLGLPPTVYVVLTDTTHFVRATARGLFAPAVALGQTVTAGDPIGRIRFPDRPDRPAEVLLTPHDGVVCVLGATPAVEIGDCLAVVGSVRDPAEFA